MLMNKKSYPVTVQKTISVPDEASAVEQKNSTAFANDCSQLFLSLCFRINNVAMCVTERSVWNFISDKEKQAGTTNMQVKEVWIVTFHGSKTKEIEECRKREHSSSSKSWGDWLLKEFHVLFNMNVFNFDLQLDCIPQRNLKAVLSEQVTPQRQSSSEQTSANDHSTTDRLCIYVICCCFLGGWLGAY